ncbi:MAG: porin family protein [Gammaproteobacteria bacterium]|nr:porin family protein [Gammaproteobacteria bacterium]
MKKTTLALSLLLTQSSMAFAQEDTYMGIEYAVVNSDITFDDWDTGMIFARFGAKLSPGLAAEAYIGLGVQDDTTTTNCDSEKVSTDSIVGAQIKASADLENVNLHANIGINQIAATFEISGTFACYGYNWTETYDDTEVGLAYGFGADFKISDQSAITANFNIFYDDTYAGADLTISALLIGYQQSF